MPKTKGTKEKDLSKGKINKKRRKICHTKMVQGSQEPFLIKPSQGYTHYYI